MVWCIGRRLASERVGLVAALLTAVNPLLFWYSQEARSYSLMLLLSALSLLSLLWALETPSARRLLAWSLVSAVALSLDRKAFIAIIGQGEADVGAQMLPPPEGLWGMPPEMLQTLPGYDPDTAKNRAEARKIMEKLGYGPDKRLSVALSSRNIAPYRDPAVILIDQVREIYIVGYLISMAHLGIIRRSISFRGVRGGLCVIEEAIECA